MTSSQIHCTIDLHGSGRQSGHLMIPYSHNLAGWANLMVPIVSLANGSGPTALVMAGNHGDEYPGQVAILRLCRELQAEQVSGRIILIPCLTVPASRDDPTLPLGRQELQPLFSRPQRRDGF